MCILKSLKFYTTAALILLLSSCSSSDPSDTSTSSQSLQSGRISLLITDGVAEDFDQVNLTVESISFIGSDDGHESIVFDQSRIINLLSLQNYSDLLTTAVIPAGSYDKIRLHVSRVELVDFDGHCQPDVCIAKLPANGKVDLNPRGSFEVFPDGHLMVELDIDAEKSIHIVEKGNGKYSYNFRPVVFINIIGVEDKDPKLLVMDGFVTERSGGQFELCKSLRYKHDDDDNDEYHDDDDDEYHDDYDEHHDDDDYDNYHQCLSISITGNTVVQDSQVDLTTVEAVTDGDRVTVLGQFRRFSAEALHIVIHDSDKAVSDLAMFNGKATTAFEIDNFTMETDDGNAVIQPLTALTIALVEGSGVRVFDKSGNVVSADEIVVGTDVDVFGLAQPDIATVSKVKAAFIIIDNEIKDEKISGTISSVDEIDAQITVTVQSDTFSGDVCIDASNAVIFILAIDDGKIVTKQITIEQLRSGMLVDAYGIDDGQACLPADALLVAEPLEVSPASALLFSGN